DIDGNVMIRPITAGKYNVKAVYLGYQPIQINDVQIVDGKTVYLQMPMSNDNVLPDVIVTEYAGPPLIDPNTISGGNISKEEFQHMAQKDVNSVISTQAGVVLTDNGSKTSIQIRGARPGNTNVFIDGERSIGTNNLPQSSVEQMSVMLGGLPAQYGDVTGGVVSITTKGVQPKWFGGVEGISSQLTDPYGYNFLGFSLGGPIISKRDSLKNKKPIVGFFMGGEIIYQKDPRPWANGIAQLTPSKLTQLQQTPLQYDAANGAYYSAASYVTPGDLTTSKVRSNVASTAIRLSPKIDFALTPNLTITVGGSIDYTKYHNFSIANSLLNSQSNPQVIENTMRGYLRLTQKFGSQNASEQEKSQSVIKRAYFSFQAGYQNYKYTQQDENFKKNYFDYGYVGKFDEKRIPVYELDSVKVKVGNSYVKQQVYALKGYRDSVINFTPGTQNPLSANYTSQVYAGVNGQITDLSQVQNLQGLRNGDSPPLVQGIYNNSGNGPASYSLRNNTIFRVTANFSADIKNHALTVGVEYDQRDERGYDVYAKGLYTAARQLANQHNQVLDTAGTYYASQTDYTNGTNIFNSNVTGNNGISETQTGGNPVSSTKGVVTYGTVSTNSLQSTFSKNFYDQIGVNGDHNPNSGAYINVDGVDPSQLSLKMFSPDELLNGGSQLVEAWGYDYSGNLLKGKTSFDDFLNKFHTDKFGDKINDRNTGGFTPVYMAGYIQDKFDFKDIKFNVGLRVDRYDANQQVLKDPFLLKDAYSTS
ncbi:MAG: TonB-dependent receptor plug domain-containing protein, partial [Bacteroidia bacterium]